METRSLLITVTGRDGPGVTAQLFTEISRYDVEVADVEQIIVRGRLILGIVLTLKSVTAADEIALRDGVQRLVRDRGLEVEFAASAQQDGARSPRSRGRLHVSLLGEHLEPGSVAAVAGRIAEAGANIDRIVRLASYPVTCLELEVSGADADGLRAVLAAEASAQGVDVAVQRSGLHRRAKRLVVMDVDSTLVQGEVIEMLAAHAGCESEVAEITAAAMRGDLDFEAALRARVALLAGMDAGAVEQVRVALRLTPGARTLIRTLKRLGYIVAIVSGGFTQLTDGLVHQLGIDHSAANTLEIVDGKFTGRLVGPVVDRAGKAEALRRFAETEGIPLAQTVAIGDGANDIDMLTAAGLGIAFNAKPVVREAAHAAVNVPFLDAILYLLGISRAEVEAADAADGLPPLSPPAAEVSASAAEGR
jgi:phosphoserine phosphatase